MEKIGKDVLIFYDNDPQMMLVELFKKYLEEYIHDKQFELGTILIEDCRKLFATYPNAFGNTEFNLFIELRNEKLFAKESEFESYIQKIKNNILLQSVNHENLKIIQVWSTNYEKSKSKCS